MNNILSKNKLTKNDIIHLLNTAGEDKLKLFEESVKIKKQYVGNAVYLRGLIEFSNICVKNCYYCGIRKDNKKISRYNLSEDEIIEAAKFAYEHNYGSIVLQSGEMQNNAFSGKVERIIKKIKKISNNKIGITLSCGEQSKETYKRWFDAGAHRYLLRIETSSKTLYKKIHPDDYIHNWDKRFECLQIIKETGYQTGTGIMIGLPFQTVENLADDLIFMQKLDIDMCGMGPYIEHEDTPAYNFKDKLVAIQQRFDTTLKMIAVLRIMMKDINIAATTALQAIDDIGREKAIRVGANILMPNITPVEYRDKYFLYDNKPCYNESSIDCKNCLDSRMIITGSNIAYGQWGDSLHFIKNT